MSIIIDIIYKLLVILYLESVRSFLNKMIIINLTRSPLRIIACATCDWKDWKDCKNNIKQKTAKRSTKGNWSEQRRNGIYCSVAVTTTLKVPDLAFEVPTCLPNASNFQKVFCGRDSVLVGVLLCYVTLSVKCILYE